MHTVGIPVLFSSKVVFKVSKDQHDSCKLILSLELLWKKKIKCNLNNIRDFKHALL